MPGLQDSLPTSFSTRAGSSSGPAAFDGFIFKSSFSMPGCVKRMSSMLWYGDGPLSGRSRPSSWVNTDTNGLFRASDFAWSVMWRPFVVREDWDYRSYVVQSCSFCEPRSYSASQMTRISSDFHHQGGWLQ